MKHSRGLPVLTLCGAGLLLAALLLLTGCADAGGSGQSPGASVSPSASTSPTAATNIPAPSAQSPTAELKISVRANGKDESSAYTLRCAGATALATSDHPRAEEACALLERSPQIVAPAPAPGTQMCTEQYGGPATARVTGALDGKAVDREFDLKNGCGISAWTDALALLVVQPTGNLY